MRVFRIVPVQGTDPLNSLSHKFLFDPDKDVNNLLPDAFKEVILEELNRNAPKEDFHMSRLYSKLIDNISKKLTKVTDEVVVNYGDMFDNFIDGVCRDPDLYVKEFSGEILKKILEYKPLITL